MSGWRCLNCLEEQGHETGWLSPDPLGWQQSCTQLIVDHHVYSLQEMTWKCQDRCCPWRMVAWSSYSQRWARRRGIVETHRRWPSGCSCFVWLCGQHLCSPTCPECTFVCSRLAWDHAQVRRCTGMCGHLTAEFSVCWCLADVAVRKVSPVKMHGMAQLCEKGSCV